MKFRYIVLTVSLLLFVKINAQADCFLGVGVTSDTIISDIFQLNKMQHKKLKSYSAELKYRNEVLTNELQNVMDRHPQTTVSELRQLADKYKEVMDSVNRVQAMIDKRMLRLFNMKQYELYQNLCKKAYRSPYVVVPTIYADSIIDENR
ncbi:hypothetical protein [Maribacter ulvicola]|uniref:Periplasmic chaperone for outer membrane proteins Skp n=1 Tax=Maribacter ulvicola TaxID=228959 RepID=A0A1N6SB55_9FLAO|nr:hypothetical protein [Maribacter ulvicola]SIQ38267.1 hypothetical protein SAMN05421797_1011590 [Maribacter ulvicola]